jgi:UDP-N-acetylmuramyl pentapeptide phosphotransferase/UDP-N-acetylglucosamine-1-phosphate transferase
VRGLVTDPAAPHCRVRLARVFALPRARVLQLHSRRMSGLLVSFVVSALLALWIVRSSRERVGALHDHDLDGPQKFHAAPVPRIGGVSIVVGLLAAATVLALRDARSGWAALLLIGCAAPTFLAGLAEDVTKRVSPRRRLLCTAVAAALAAWLLDAQITRTAIPGLDAIVATPWGAFIVTVFVVTGVANAFNIIDGFNGLASMCAVMMLVGLAYVAFQVGDAWIGLLALATVGAVLGFFIFNFPGGYIFLGDGGAYLLGFVIAELALLLLHRQPTVSPMFPLLLCLYPVFETLFSIYRRKWLRGDPVGAPDAVHLHSLIYRRFLRRVTVDETVRDQTLRNSMTSPYLWMVCSLSVVPAMLWYDDTAALAATIFVFAVGYVVLYWRIVRFRAPRWMLLKRVRR